MGTLIRKVFDGVSYLGCVRGHVFGWNWIVYADGDTEDLDDDVVQSLRVDSNDDGNQHVDEANNNNTQEGAWVDTQHKDSANDAAVNSTTLIDEMKPSERNTNEMDDVDDDNGSDPPGDNDLVVVKPRLLAKVDEQQQEDGKKTCNHDIDTGDAAKRPTASSQFTTEPSDDDETKPPAASSPAQVTNEASDATAMRGELLNPNA